MDEQWLLTINGRDTVTVFVKSWERCQKPDRKGGHRVRATTEMFELLEALTHGRAYCSAFAGAGRMAGGVWLFFEVFIPTAGKRIVGAPARNRV
ncbi:MAG: hypothetical protein QOH41_3304 [Blastocatellia bacterium]|nr:hypothetical protein [Blastocatellia bacterium]